MIVRWGIIGCGDVTEVKSGPAFQQVAGSALAAVMRRNGALAADYARRHGVPNWYDDADALIADPDVDAVYVATPPGSHCEHALRACRAGKPAYVEKPLARNHPECQAMVDAFRSARLKLFVAYYRRALPRFLKVKELIDAGRLGSLTSAHYEYAEPPRAFDSTDLPWRYRAEASGGGLFFDIGSHALDLLDFLLGPLVDVDGRARNITTRHDVEDQVEMRFRTEAGASGTATWDFASSRSRDMIEIHGTSGVVSFAVFGGAPIQWVSGHRAEVLDLPHPPHIEQPMIQTVVDDLLGRGACASTGESAARTAAVMDRATLGYYGSRSDGFWNRSASWPGRRGRSDAAGER